MRKNIKKTIISAGMLTSVMLPVAYSISCGDNNKNRIAFIKSTDNSSYDQLLSDLGKEYATKLGYAWDAVSSSKDPSQEKARIDDIISSKKYKVVVFQPVDTSGSFNNLKKLLDANLFVSVPDRIFSADQIKTLNANQKKHLTMMITSDNTQIAKDATKLLFDKLLANDKDVFNTKVKLIKMIGETESASSKERGVGFEQYLNEWRANAKNSSIKSNIEVKELVGDWKASQAQTKFEGETGDTAKGIGAFVFNDQMAHGIITSTGNNKNIGRSGFYPIATVDGHKLYKDEIGDGKSIKQRVIANYAQRSHTTMKLAVYSVIYGLLKDKFKQEKEIKWIEDDQTTTADDDGKTKLRDVTKAWDANNVIIKLSGIAITRGKDGKLINEEWMVD